MDLHYRSAIFWWFRCGTRHLQGETAFYFILREPLKFRGIFLIITLEHEKTSIESTFRSG